MCDAVSSLKSLSACPALCAGRCALNRSVRRNSEGPCRVRSDVAAGSQTGIESATNWAVDSVVSLIDRSIRNLFFSLAKAGGPIVHKLLLSGVIVARPAHDRRRRGGAITNKHRSKCDCAYIQISKHPPTFFPGFSIEIRAPDAEWSKIDSRPRSLTAR